MNNNLYKINDIVPQDGRYICVPCAYIMEFKKGDKFTVCPLCLAGTKEGPIEEQDEFWRLAE